MRMRGVTFLVAALIASPAPVRAESLWLIQLRNVPPFDMHLEMFKADGDDIYKPLPFLENDEGDKGFFSIIPDVEIEKGKFFTVYSYYKHEDGRVFQLTMKSQSEDTYVKQSETFDAFVLRFTKSDGPPIDRYSDDEGELKHQRAVFFDGKKRIILDLKGGAGEPANFTITFRYLFPGKIGDL